MTTLFTWFSTAAAFGLVFLMAITSVAVLFWFRRNHHGYGVFTRVIAPGAAALFLVVIAVLILMNFDIMIGEESPRAMIFIMPGIIIGTGVLGALWSLRFDREIDINAIPIAETAVVDESRTGSNAGSNAEDTQASSPAHTTI